MAQYSMSTATVQRSHGSSAVAHAAYVSGSMLVDERTGQESDYTHRAGVECVASQIVVPTSERETQSAQVGRSHVWNLAEAAEKRKDGRPARKVLVALPHELTPDQRQEAVQEYAQWIADRFHVAVDYAIHTPDREGDQRNYHAHMVMTTREIRDGKLSAKSVLEWEDKKLKAAGLPTGKAMVLELRQQWERVHNQALQKHAPQVEPVSCRALRDQAAAKREEARRLAERGRDEEATEAKLKAVELDRTPQQHVGWQATALERQGIKTERGNDRRAAQAEHKQQLGLVAQIRDRIATLLERGKAAAIAAAAKLGAEVQEFIRRHGLTSRRQAEPWFETRLKHLQAQIYEKPPYSARDRFEISPVPGNAGQQIGAELSGAAANVTFYEKKRKQIEREIAEHRDPRSLFQRLKGEPDNELESLNAKRKDALERYGWAQETIAELEQKWERERPDWERYATQVNAEIAARNESLKAEILKVTRLRGDVVAELARRDKDPAARNRPNQRQQQRSRDWDLER